MTFNEFAKSLQKNDYINRSVTFTGWKIKEEVVNYNGNNKFTLRISAEKDKDNRIVNNRDVELLPGDGNLVDLIIHPRYGYNVIDGENSGETRDKGIPLRAKNVDFIEADSLIVGAMAKLFDDMKKRITFKEESIDDSGEILEMKPKIPDALKDNERWYEILKNNTSILDKQSAEYNGFKWEVDEVEVSDNGRDITFDVIIGKKDRNPAVFILLNGSIDINIDNNDASLDLIFDRKHCVVGHKNTQIFAEKAYETRTELNGRFPDVLKDGVEIAIGKVISKLSKLNQTESLNKRINNLIEELR